MTHDQGGNDELDGIAGAYDVIVIGGGINGAGIARATALAGYHVLLVDKEDFGWGTTWRSTKLIHGGLRYLEHAEFGLVFEALRDQKTLLAEYPQMVRPLSFVLPVYDGDRHGPTTIDLGLRMYDALSVGRSLPSHRRYSASSARLLEPALSREGLRGAFTYSDCQVAYPERLCVQTVLEARDAGATVLNHTEVMGFTLNEGTVTGVTVRTHAGKPAVEVGAAVVVNAAGPWVDGVLGNLPHPEGHTIGGTKGAHIVVDYGAAGPLQAIYAEARSDRRPFFVLPWRGRHLIGTTDTRFAGSPDEVRATQADVGYLLEEANRLLPSLPITRADVLYAYAGVRPLAASDGIAEGAITRRHVIRDHAREGHKGLLSIIGGKLSTYRSLASETLERIREQVSLPQSSMAGRLYQREGLSMASGAPALDAAAGVILPDLLDYLRSLYGPRLATLLQIIGEDYSRLRPLCGHGPDIEAQVVLATRSEGARTLSDVLFRRTGVAWNSCLGFDAASRAAVIAGRELGWSATRVDEEVSRYSRDIARTFSRASGLPAEPHNALAL